MYTKPLKVNEYTYTPPLAVPAHIERPPYVNQSPQVFPDINTEPIHVMNAEQTEGLRKAANLGARTLKHALDNTEEGMTMDDVDAIVHNYIIGDEGYPSAIGFHGFAKSVCTSVNDVVSHGVPNSYRLQDGDYLNIDVVCYKHGHHGDNSAMKLIGAVHPDVVKLSEATRAAMFKAIANCRPGANFGQIGETI
jgi:methionyl aminopeptidase